MKTRLFTLLLLLSSSSVLALDVRPLKDKPATVVEELPAVPLLPKEPEKKSLVEHLQSSPSVVPSGPPTSLPPPGKLPPLPPGMAAPSGKWSELPPLPDGTKMTAPARSSGSKSSGNKRPAPKAAQVPAAPTVDYKANFAQCITEVQQQYSGSPTKLLRNDNQVYSIVVLDNGQRKIVTCSIQKGKVIE